MYASRRYDIPQLQQNILFHGIAKDHQLIFMGFSFPQVLQGQCNMAQTDAMHAVGLSGLANKCTHNKTCIFNYMKL